MGWNDPGNGNKNGNGNNPWGNDKGPPDLDEALKQLQRKVAGLFGGGSGGQFDTGGGKSGGMAVWFIGIIVLAVYVLSGIYIVQPYEEAVIKRFGKYERTEGPGPHWTPRFIESRTILNVEEVRNFEIRDQMLTKDENIIKAAIAIQYKIHDSKAYLFNVIGPDVTISQVAGSALRSVVGQSTLNEVLTSGRTEVTRKIREQVEHTLNEYGVGLIVSDLAMQRTSAPDEVKASFDDAINAQQDEERFKNEAQAYANQEIPLARGQAKRIYEEAEAYKQQKILEAKGRTARFEQLYPEYKRQPEILRDRLYIDTLEEVYAKTNKVIVDVDGGNNLMVLPLDQITRQGVKLADVASAAENYAKANQSSNTSLAKVEKSSRGARPRYDDVNRYSGRG